MSAASTARAAGTPNAKPMTLAIIKANASSRGQKVLGVTAADKDGVHYDVPGHMVYVDYVEMMAAQRARYQERAGQ